jgi:ABC-type phosphate transport system permease subunit
MDGRHVGAGTLNLIKMKALGVVVFVLIIVIAAFTINGWTAEAKENAIDAFTKSDQEAWEEETQYRTKVGGYVILGLTAAVAVVFASGIFERLADEEEEEEEELAEAVSTTSDG